MNTIRHWNPAWGPEPERVGRHTQRAGWATRGRNAWRLVRCPRVECANAQGYMVYVRLPPDGSGLAESYHCAVCGAEMRQEEADAQ